VNSHVIETQTLRKLIDENSLKIHKNCFRHSELEI